MKKYISLLCAAVLVLSLCACSSGTEKEETTVNSAESFTVSKTENITEQTLAFTEITATTLEEIKENKVDSTTQKSTEKNIIPEEKTTVRREEKTTIAETMGKTGEMAFSDKASNRYIKSISSKYKVDAGLLAAIYTVPENDSNIVLEFDGTKDSSGKLKRNKDTLVAIYTIDKALNSKRASENKELNEYSYGEMKVIYFSTIKYIMPEFEGYL